MILMRIMYDLRCTQRRFAAKVLRRGPDECWPWLGRKNSTLRPRQNGHIREPYGTFAIRGRSVYAHRWALFGPVALTTKDKALHTCDNPLCCNPRHLYAGSGADNLRDAFERKRIARNERGDFARPAPPIGTVIHSDFDVASTIVDASEHIIYWAGAPVIVSNGVSP